MENPSRSYALASADATRNRSGCLGLCCCCRRRSSSSFPSLLPLLALFSSATVILLCLHMAVEDVVSQTRTVAGHNLEPTPWHLFPINKPRDASRIFRCSYLSCPPRIITSITTFPSFSSSATGSSQSKSSCPSFFRWIRRDLEPWRRSGISASMLAEARRHAAMRIVILGGRRLFVDLYYGCVQSRAMFTVWGLLQLLRRYPGMVPDVDFMFDCMDRPSVNRSQYPNPPPPPPLFRYCTTRDHFDIPFPDWSFWGW